MNKTFTFLQRILSPPHSLSKNSLPPAIIRRMSSNLMKAPLQELTPAASQNTPPDSLLESIHKNLTQSPSTPPTPSRLHLPGYSPPLRPPAGLQDGKGWGDLHSSFPLIPSPSPVLHSVHTHTTHLIPSVHQNWPLKVLNIYSFCHLSVEAT